MLRFDYFLTYGHIMKSIEIDGITYRFFDHLYAVSRCGKVLRKLAPYTPTNHQGYLALGRHRLMHRVVATCWLGNPTNAKHVHHKNGIKTDNRAENLEWVSPKEHFGDRHSETIGKHAVSDEEKSKLRLNRLGKKHSEETKAKISKSGIGKAHKPFARKKHSQEWKDNISLNHHKNTHCIIFGVTYRSFAEASRTIGIHRFTIRKRCLSKNFPNYEIISS
jgi:hypothetical protein